MAKRRQNLSYHYNSLLIAFALQVFFCDGDGVFSESVKNDYTSAVGDPGMRRDSLRVAIESWNQCNEAGEEAPLTGSPRAADCFDIYQTSPLPKGLNYLDLISRCPVFLILKFLCFTYWVKLISCFVFVGKECCIGNALRYLLVHRVTPIDNALKMGDPFPGMQPNALHNVDLYAAEKELYLGSKCQVEDTPNPWHFWMIMLKSGNMDTFAARCPKNGAKVGAFGPDSNFPCFGSGCMNQPTIHHDYTSLQGPNRTSLKGRFYGSWDLEAKDLGQGSMVDNISYHSVTWEKEIKKGSWVFHHILRTSTKYPWLMLYLRSDATRGFSGGYHYPTKGMSKIVSNPLSDICSAPNIYNIEILV